MTEPDGGEKPESVLAEYERSHGIQRINRNMGWLALNGTVMLGLAGSRNEIFDLIGHGLPQQLGLWAVVAGAAINLVRLGLKSRGETLRSVISYHTLRAQGRQRGPEGQPGSSIPKGPDEL